MSSQCYALSHSKIPDLYGLVLAGGHSSRMGTNKAHLEYQGKPHVRYCFELLDSLCARTFISIRTSMASELMDFPCILDYETSSGPISGILAAMRQHPHCAWLVVACDLPHLKLDILENLITNRKPALSATAYQSPADSLPEPLCTIYEPKIFDSLGELIQKNRGPRDVLINSQIKTIHWANSCSLLSANTPEEREQAIQILSQKENTLSERLR